MRKPGFHIHDIVVSMQHDATNRSTTYMPPNGGAPVLILYTSSVYAKAG